MVLHVRSDCDGYQQWLTPRLKVNFLCLTLCMLAKHPACAHAGRLLIMCVAITGITLYNVQARLRQF